MKITTEKYEIETSQDVNHPAISATVITRLIDGRVLYCDLPVSRIGEQLATLDNYLNGYMSVEAYPLDFKAGEVNAAFNEMFYALSGFNRAQLKAGQ